MLLPLLLTVLASSSLVVYYFNSARIHRDGKSLRKAPDSHPLLGHAIKFLQPRHLLFDWFVQCQRKFGNETVEISVPTLPLGVIIHDPYNLEFVLKNESRITKGQFFQKRSWDLFGGGIINATGNHWKAQRKAGLKFFSGDNLEMMIEDVLPETYSKVKADLFEHATESTVIDLQRVFQNATTAVVGRMAYDMQFDASHPFSTAFDYASDKIGLRFQNPFYPLTELFTGSKLRQSLIKVKKFGRTIVMNARKQRSFEAFESLITNNDTKFGSLIDSLLETFSDPTIVADSALNFLSAGRDTTAQGLTWISYALMRHPEVLKPLRLEIEDVMGECVSRDGSQNLRVPDLQPNSIPLTMAVIYESLRLYPPVPFELKQCQEDIVLPDGTFLPRNTIVVWCLWAINRSKEVYGQDADTFRPSRWLDEGGKFVPRSAFEYPVFHGGPRACLGKKMAEVICAYFTINILRDFDLEEIRDPQNATQERVSHNSLTLPMKDGLPSRPLLRVK